MNSILYVGEEEKNLTDEDSFTSEDYRIIEEAEEIIRNNNPDFKPVIKKKHVALLTFSIIFFILFIFIAVFSTIFALMNMGHSNIMSGVSALGIDLSGLSKEQAKEKIIEETNNRISTELVLKHNDETYTLHLLEIDANYDIDKLVDSAYIVGRTGNIFISNYEILNCMIHPKALTASISYNADNFLSVLAQMEGSFSDGLNDPYYEIDGTNLTIHAGKDGYVIDSKALINLLTEKLTASSYDSNAIEIPVLQKQANQINIDMIHTEIYKEAKDAYYTTNPFAVFPSSTGIDFAISIDEAKALITGESDTYTIPLKVLYPSVTTNDIGTEAFPNSLATYSTSYATSNANRSSNIALASSKINGMVLMPGDVFSFNNSVGRRTAANGFKVAGVYVNGQVTNDYGGGICQVSSTLYNAVLRANLEIVERTNHMFNVGYVPIGTDATVSWGAPDFKFKNSRSYPIKIVTSNYNKRLTVTIYGLKEDNEYSVEIVSYQTGTVPFRTTYVTDNSLASGQTKVIQSGSNGATSVAYRILKQNGVEVSRQLLSKDTYSPHNQIIARGQ